MISYAKGLKYLNPISHIERWGFVLLWVLEIAVLFKRVFEILTSRGNLYFIGINDFGT
jgi:hypothetical protein